MANPDAERLALAAMLLDGDLVVDAVQKFAIEQADFSDSRFAMLYGVLVDLVVEQGVSLSGTFIIDELISRYSLAYSEANELAALWASPDLIPGPLVFEQHVEMLKRASAVRRLQAGVREVFERIQNGFDEPDQLGDLAVETIRQYLPAAEPGDDGVEDQPFSLDLGEEPTAALGWVAVYADQISAMTSSPRSFNLLNALVLASTAVGLTAKLNMTFGTVRPNLYGALVGASSVYHKSTALNRARDVLRRAGLDRSLLPESGTSEGLLAALADQPSGLIIRDEIGRLFGSDRVRHLANYKADLTDLFGGETVRKRLSGVELLVENPYLCILGATTPARFFDAVGAADWDDGFLVRWLFALPDCEPRFETIGFYESDAVLDQKLNDLAAPLRRIAAQKDTSFIFLDDAFERWDNWQRERLQRAYQYGDETALAISARLGTAALKLAIILAAVNGEWGRITPERMGAAIWLADYFRRNLWKLLNDKAQHGVSGHKLAKVLQVINRHGSAGCTNRQIMRGAHLKSHQLRPVLDKLLQIGAVIPSDDGKRVRGVHDKLPVKNYL
jgi:hypothetical protein